jgi:hypothetical protein
VELVKAGIDVVGVRAYLAAHATDLLATWEQIVELARAEEEGS